MNLGGISVEDVKRGEVLGPAGSVFETELIDAEIRWITEVKHGLRVRIAVGTEEVNGRLLLGKDSGGLVQIRLETKIACALGEPLIVRRYSPPDLLGGGIVRIPQAVPRARRTVEMIAEAASPKHAVLNVLEGKTQGVTTEEICRILSKTPQEMGTTFEAMIADGTTLGFAGLWYGMAEFRAAKEQFLNKLGELHLMNPTQGFQPREKPARAAGLRWDGKPFDRIITKLTQDGDIESGGTLVRRADFRVQLTPRQRDLLDRVKSLLEQTPINVPTHGELANKLGIPIQAADEILKLGAQAGETVTISQGLSFTVGQLEMIAQEMRRAFQDRGFTPAEFRDLISSSRKYVIPLLEYFDSHRVTLRTGDQRFMRSPNA